MKNHQSDPEKQLPLPSPFPSQEGKVDPDPMSHRIPYGPWMIVYDPTTELFSTRYKTRRGHWYTFKAKYVTEVKGHLDHYAK